MIKYYRELLLLNGIQVYCKHVLDDIEENMPNEDDKKLLDMLCLKYALYNVKELKLEIEQEESVLFKKPKFLDKIL